MKTRWDAAGLRVADLLDLKLLKTHIENACREKNMIAHALFNTEPLDADKMYAGVCRGLGEDRALRLRHSGAAEQAMTEGESVVFEGAQGTMLDIDHGTYPFVTSSSATSGGAVIGTGVAPTAIDTVIGVTKAYCTRVGEGPFPTESHDATGDQLRARGNEYGAVTGRPRRCGWLDLPLLRYAGMINGISWLVVTKLDVLDELAEIPVCVGYKINGKETDGDSGAGQRLRQDRVHLPRICLAGELPLRVSRELDKLPKAAREYLAFSRRKAEQRSAWFQPDRAATDHFRWMNFAAEMNT